jgi:hypothetical protein
VGAERGGEVVKQDFSGYFEERPEGIVKRSFVGPKPPPVALPSPKPRTIHRYRIRANANVFGGWDITMRIERRDGADYTFCLHPNDRPQALFDEVSHNEWPTARTQPSCDDVAPPPMAVSPDVSVPREPDLILKAPAVAGRQIEYVSIVIRKLTVYHIVDQAKTQEANDWRLMERYEGKPAVKVARCGYQQEYPLTYDHEHVRKDVARRRPGHRVRICGRCR